METVATNETNTQTVEQLLNQEQVQINEPVIEEHQSESDEVSEIEAADDSADVDTAALPPEVQKKIGALLAKERRKLQAKYEKQRYQQQNQTAYAPVQQAPQQQGVPEGMIYDEAIGQYVDVNSPIGQIVLREQAKQQYQKQLSLHTQREQIREALLDGYEKYDNYGDAFENFRRNATDDMADALGADLKNAPDVIAYFADKESELQRISRLTPANQAAAIIRVLDRLKPKKQLVTNAPAPVSKVKQTSGVRAGSTPENMNTEQINAFWENHFNKR